MMILDGFCCFFGDCKKSRHAGGRIGCCHRPIVNGIYWRFFLCDSKRQPQVTKNTLLHSLFCLFRVKKGRADAQSEA